MYKHISDRLIKPSSPLPLGTAMITTQARTAHTTHYSHDTPTQDDMSSRLPNLAHRTAPISRPAVQGPTRPGTASSTGSAPCTPGPRGRIEGPASLNRRIAGRCRLLRCRRWEPVAAEKGRRLRLWLYLVEVEVGRWW